MGEEILVVGNGIWEMNSELEKLLSLSDFVIALDGAADKFQEWDVVIGDMDSIGNPESHQSDNNQNNSDLAKALEKYDVKRVYGIDGGRLDHRYGAFSALFETKSNAILYIGTWRACRVPDSGLKIRIPPGSKCGLFPLGIVSEISTNGFEFNLDKKTISTGTLGLGNVAIEKEIIIKKSSGDLLFTWEGNEP